MGMEMKLQFKLAQQLVMTPQLVQAIRLLQLSRMELVDEVRKELDGNPVLADEIAEPRGRQETSATTPAASPKDRDLAPEERVGVSDQEIPYPYVFERRPGEIWLTAWRFGGFRVRLREKDFVRE